MFDSRIFLIALGWSYRPARGRPVLLAAVAGFPADNNGLKGCASRRIDAVIVTAVLLCVIWFWCSSVITIVLALARLKSAHCCARN